MSKSWFDATESEDLTSKQTVENKTIGKSISKLVGKPVLETDKTDSLYEKFSRPLEQRTHNRKYEPRSNGPRSNDYKKRDNYKSDEPRRNDYKRITTRISPTRSAFLKFNKMLILNNGRQYTFPCRFCYRIHSGDKCENQCEKCGKVGEHAKECEMWDNCQSMIMSINVGNSKMGLDTDDLPVEISKYISSIYDYMGENGIDCHLFPNPCKGCAKFHPEKCHRSCRVCGLVGTHSNKCFNKPSLSVLTKCITDNSMTVFKKMTKSATVSIENLKVEYSKDSTLDRTNTAVVMNTQNSLEVQINEVVNSADIRGSEKEDLKVLLEVVYDELVKTSRIKGTALNDTLCTIRKQLKYSDLSVDVLFKKLLLEKVE